MKKYNVYICICNMNHYSNCIHYIFARLYEPYELTLWVSGYCYFWLNTTLRWKDGIVTLFNCDVRIMSLFFNLSQNLLVTVHNHFNQVWLKFCRLMWMGMITCPQSLWTTKRKPKPTLPWHVFSKWVLFQRIQITLSRDILVFMVFLFLRLYNFHRNKLDL